MDNSCKSAVRLSIDESSAAFFDSSFRCLSSLKSDSKSIDTITRIVLPGLKSRLRNVEMAALGECAADVVMEAHAS